MTFNKIENTVLLNDLKIAYYKELKRPLDGMWEQLYIANCDTYSLEVDDMVIGYFKIDAENSLLEFYIVDSHKPFIRKYLHELINQKIISSASLSSGHPLSFNTCLELSKSHNIHTYLYSFDKKSSNRMNHDFNLSLALGNDENRIKEFFKTEISFEDTFGYTANLINRSEIYLLEKDKNIIATGECRLSDSQSEYADVGMIVASDYQKQGLGTLMLNLMARIALEKNKKPICSTTIDNIASQRAIQKTGFYPEHIIFHMTF